MGKAKILVIISFIAVLIPLSNSHSTTIYVARDSTGDYICDGVNDNIEINLALTHADTSALVDSVYLKGPATYWISDRIWIGSGTTLTGDSTAEIKLIANALWGPSQTSGMVNNKAAGNRDIVISGFEIDGNKANNPEGSEGQYYYTNIFLTGLKNGTVSHMWLHDGKNDGVTLKGSCDSIYFHDNTVLCGHDALYAVKANHVWAWNNTISLKTNSGLRSDGTNNFKAWNNNIYGVSGSGGGNAFEIQSGSTIMSNVEIWDNYIHDTNNPGIWFFGYSNQAASNIYIHHNKFYSPGRTTGITGAGFNVRIENNVIYGYSGYGVRVHDSYSADPTGGPYTITVCNNIICNITGSYAVYNNHPSLHTLVVQNNCFWNNSGINWAGSNVTAENNLVNVNPQFVDAAAHDYHLKSWKGRWSGTEWVSDTVNSPCIDAGYPESDYSNEPQPNGGRINIGLYGNTSEASKSTSPSVKESTPLAFSLAQNTPNPFNPSTTISFTIPESMPVRISVFDLRGQKIASLIDENVLPGIHSLKWEPRGISSGIYFYRIEAGNYIETKKLVFMK